MQVQVVLGKRAKGRHRWTRISSLDVDTPGGSLVPALSHMVAARTCARLSTVEGMLSGEKVMLKGVERSCTAWNAPGVDTPGAFCVLP
jgi:hypothetical protein